MALERLACMQHRNDEVLNQELAKDLAALKDRHGIKEIAQNLWNPNTAIANDCIKVVYEIGHLEPRLISPYARDLVRLLKSKNNRMVWGAMSALATIADIRADRLFEDLAEIEHTVEHGSVITQDQGIAALANIASKKPHYRRKIFPFLLGHLETCRPKDIPQHSEKSLPAVDARNKSAFVRVLTKRKKKLSPPQLKRVEKVIKQAELL